MVREALSLARLKALSPSEAAACVIARRDLGFAPGEAQVLALWLAADPRHGEALEAAEQGWRAFDDVAGHEVLDAMRAHARAPRPKRSFWPPAAAIAAVLVAAIALTAVLRPSLMPRTPGADAPAAVTYASARGEVREVQLADGSKMTLDADSTAVVVLAHDRRSVSLDRGRAYFDVASDKARPFAVAAAGREVVAVGTRFDVNRLSQGLVVTLLEGRVVVGKPGSDAPPISLNPGQRFVEQDGRSSVQMIPLDGEDAIAWRTGVARFDDETLAEAIVEMNRYAAKPIVIRDRNVAALRVSGRFKANDTDRFVDTVAELHGLRVERGAEGLELAAGK